MKKITAVLLCFLLLGLGGCAQPVPAEPTPLTVIGTTAPPETTTAAPIQTTTQDTAARTTVPYSTAATSRTSLVSATTQTAAATRSVRSADVEARFSVMTTEEKVGQLFCVSLSESESLTEADREMLQDCHFGNIILYSANIRSCSQLAALNASLLDTISADTGICPFIAVDQEGGTVMRIVDACTAPPAMAVGSAGDPSLARQLGEMMGAQLRTLGINVNLAPVADINSNPDNPVIGSRSFSEDPEIAAVFVSAYTEGLQSAGVLACLKHFPGHGNTALDSHTALPSVSYSRQRLDSAELVPFRAGIAAGAAMTLVGHILYPALGADTVPASLSRSVIEGVLREELGFGGLVVTDSLSMGAITNTWGEGEACIMAVNAGTDVLLINDSEENLREAYKAVLLAVEDGRIAQSRLDEAVRRILNAKNEYGILDGNRPSAALPDTEAYSALLDVIARQSLSVTDGAPGSSFDPSSTLVVFTKPARPALNRETQSFGAYMARTYGCDATQVDRRPSDRQITELREIAGRYDSVILAVSGRDCMSLTASLAAVSSRLAVVVLDSSYAAYVYGKLGADGVLCAWEYTDHSVRAAAARLMNPYS